MHKYLIAILLALSVFGESDAQRPDVIKFDDLAQWTQADDETLYVLNFWATWCRPCVAEMPYFDQLQENYADQNVKVIFISMDFVEDIETRLMPFLKRKQPQSKVVLLDEPKYNDWIDKVSPDWSGAIPATLFVNKSKGIYHFHEGDYTYETLEKTVQSLQSKL